MRTIIATIATLAAVVLLCSCGGGGGFTGFPPAPASIAGPSLRAVEEFHGNGLLASQGTVLDENGRALRHGRWRSWFANGQARWDGTYQRDGIAADQPWREWNEDGSIRDDAADGR